MTSAQRRARADLRRYGVDCEIALCSAARATSDRWRRYHLGRAARLADLALHFAPVAAGIGGAA
jgi:hypothetical protein